MAFKRRNWFQRIYLGPPRRAVDLGYFEDIWPVELRAINLRRGRLKRPEVRQLKPEGTADKESPSDAPPASAAREGRGLEPKSRARSPAPQDIFDPATLSVRPPRSDSWVEPYHIDPKRPDPDKMRPQPVPCDATGLALSGGGIRSAAVCLGALQALHLHRRLHAIDYLSTVSGGGYIGASLSAAMSGKGVSAFPFGDDKFDSNAISHLRNYSNYLMPRGRSGLRNAAEAAVVILRGLVANITVVVTLMLAAALLTRLAYPNAASLDGGSFVIRLFGPLRPWVFGSNFPHTLLTPFLAALISAGALLAVLVAWAVGRSFPRKAVGMGDTAGPTLWLARWLLIATVVLAILDLQPLLIEAVLAVHHGAGGLPQWLSHWGKWLSGGAAGFAGVVSTASNALGHFLKKTERAPGAGTIALRLAAKLAVYLAAAVLPLAIWGLYLLFAATAVTGWTLPRWLGWAGEIVSAWPWLHHGPAVVRLYLALWIIGTGISVLFGANGYSLHRFYRDRLSKAFLFKPGTVAVDPTAIDPEPLDDIKLSDLKDEEGPYHIVNTAMNVQGSVEANRRGRNADFFIFTRDFIGSDLTMYANAAKGAKTAAYAATPGMEAVDPALDLATAMAISGAAISANMGSKTVRALSPTLALLNIRLGYWLRNPRHLARHSMREFRLDALVRRFTSKFYLLAEMLNLHDETKPVVYLTDGGHIENLGLYELLKRGCQMIVVVDAEADPNLAFPSLLKVERYARIDLGIRIVLPWEGVADICNRTSAEIAEGRRPSQKGPHCAVGEIYYADGSEGVLIYFKSTVTGDEKDYLLDYKRRNPSFPHETTGDQFFTEEQFEMYRALGFHMVDRFFSRGDHFHIVLDRNFAGDWGDLLREREAVFARVDALLPAIP